HEHRLEAQNVGTSSSPVRAGIRRHRAPLLELHGVFRRGAALRHCYHSDRREHVLERWGLRFLRGDRTGFIWSVYSSRLPKGQGTQCELAAAERRTLTQRGGLYRAKAIMASVPKLAGRLKTGVTATAGRARFWKRRNRAE